jgi:ERCC4-type nuclease
LEIFFGQFDVGYSYSTSDFFYWFDFLANDKDIQIEAILDYIVERKRLDDLSKSIIDGRYNEQKVDFF